MDARTAESLLAFAEEVSPAITGPAGKASLERLEARSADLLAAIGWFVEAGRTDEALRLANSLYRLWITTQRFQEGAVEFDLVLGSPGGDELLHPIAVAFSRRSALAPSPGSCRTALSV